jgi:N-acyl-L-homoserine lactone synthetase
MQAERFCTYLADTLEAQSLHHHLRYRVYCERKHFEEGSFNDFLPEERDEYDLIASRFIAKDRLAGSWIGTSRLVPNDLDLLPAQRLGAVSPAYADTFSRARAAEVSRLSSITVHHSTHYMCGMLQNIIIAALDYSRHTGIEWLVFLVSPGLARILQRVRVPMEACGPEIEHRGVRRAFRSNVAEAIQMIPWATALRQGTPGYGLFSDTDTDNRAAA